MPPACKREITPLTMHLQGRVGQPKYTASSNGRQLEASPLPPLRLLFVLNWASPGFLQSHEPPCFLWLQSGLFCLHRLHPSSSRYVPFLFRIHIDFLKGRFPETTTRSDLLETLAQIAFLWEGHSPPNCFLSTPLPEVSSPGAGAAFTSTSICSAPIRRPSTHWTPNKQLLKRF